MLAKQELEKALIGVGVTPIETQVIGLQGDRSLRDTALSRERVENFSDEHMMELASLFSHLMKNTSVHRLSVGFNNCEVKTFSVFDPLNMEIHRAEDIVRASYYITHFPLLHYEAKEAFIHRLYDHVLNDEEMQKRPQRQDRIFQRNASIKLTPIEELDHVFEALPKLRQIDGYYLRSMIINQFNSTLSMSFNCDGTHLMAMTNFDEFLETNF